MVGLWLLYYFYVEVEYAFVLGCVFAFLASIGYAGEYARQDFKNLRILRQLPLSGSRLAMTLTLRPLFLSTMLVVPLLLCAWFISDVHTGVAVVFGLVVVSLAFSEMPRPGGTVTSVLLLVAMTCCFWAPDYGKLALIAVGITLVWTRNHLAVRSECH